MECQHCQQHAHPLAPLFKLELGQGQDTTPTARGILNLSKAQLSAAQTRALGRGLKFIPAPSKVNREPLLEAVSKFDRRIRLTHFFAGRENEHTYNPNDLQHKFKHPSKWSPPDTAPEISQILEDLKDKVQTAKLQNPEPNIPKEELQGLRNLKQNPDIIIKPADKGAGTVIMDRDAYIFEAEKQLNNPKHYRHLDEPIYPQTAKKIATILKNLFEQEFITEDMLDFLMPDQEPRPRQFYLLPKIHKEKEKWTLSNRMPPGRPIVSDCSSESYAVSAYVDHFLLPLSTSHPSYLKNTTHFLQTLQSHTIPQDSLLITIDVDALYTNIPNDSGIQAVKEAFQNSPDPTRPDRAILELLELTLKSNDFTFNNQWYLQIFGTAMGKIYAPNYANIFMAKWEHEALAKCHLQPLLYKRYLDDIFMIWTHGKEAFNNFFQILNSHDDSIKLKFEIHDTEVNFLDTTVYKGPRFQREGLLDHKVYIKPTDTQQLLHKHSYHPKHTFKGLIKSQILRYQRICNNQDDLEEACKQLFAALQPRLYSKRFLRHIKNSTLHPPEEKPTGCSLGCRKPTCKLCPYVPLANTVVSSHSQKDIPLHTYQDCDSRNGIYYLRCGACEKGYVGETKNSFRVRLTQHLSDINTAKPTALAQHFQENENGCELIHLEVYFLETFEKLPEEYKNKSRRLERERFWTQKLEAFQPHGFNVIPKPLENPVLPLVIPYSNTAIQISKMARDAFDQLRAKFPKAFHQRFLPAYKRNPNIADQLVSAKLAPTTLGAQEAPRTVNPLSTQPAHPTSKPDTSNKHQGTGGQLPPSPPCNTTQTTQELIAAPFLFWGPISPKPGDKIWPHPLPDNPTTPPLTPQTQETHTTTPKTIRIAVPLNQITFDLTNSP